MRKSLMFLTALLVLALAGGIASIAALDGQQDSIAVTQKTLYGDPAAVADLQVTAALHNGANLYWQTTSTAGADIRTETKFSFSSKGYDWVEDWTGARFDWYFSSVNYSMSGSLDLEDKENGGDWERYDTLLLPAIDVAGRTAAGETRTETCNLGDYYQYMRLTADYQLPGTDYQKRVLVLNALNDYFRVPVPDQCPVEVTVTKDETGQVCDVECHDLREDDEGSIWSVGTSAVCTDRGIYLAMSGRCDVSQIQGGYGVWFLPYGETDQGVYLDTAHLTNVYPLDASEVTGVTIQANWDGSQIYLLTQQDGEQTLTVLDCASGQALQQLELGQETVASIWARETAAVVLNGDWETNEFKIQTFVNDNGTLTPWLKTPLYQLNQEENTYREPAVFFDGERLVLGSFQDSWHLASYRLTAYDRSGLVYAGDYTSSADDLPGTPFVVGDGEMQITQQ